MWSTVLLAAEDLPGIAVGRRLVQEQPGLSVCREVNAGGYGNLRKRATNYNRMGSMGFPVLLLTDLDSDPCPSKKIIDWLGDRPNRGFLFRICVREIEAWLLADHEGMASFLGVPTRKLPLAPESLLDPKATLIRIAQKSPRRIREGLTPTGRATIGYEYNDRLTEFISVRWSVEAASTRSPSLARARRHLAELASMVTPTGYQGKPGSR